MFSKINLDVLGITASVLCAIHCAVLPLLLVSLPVLGINIIHNASFEYGMIALAFLIGSWALLHGFRRHHGRPGPWLLFTGGMLLLVAKQLWHAYELEILPFAVSLIVGAHVLNYRWGRRAPAAGQAEISAETSDVCRTDNEPLVQSGDRAA